MSTPVSVTNFEQLTDKAFEAADFLKTLANANRLVILSKLLHSETCVGDLEKSLNISQSALSQHLSRMRAEGLVSTRRDSQQIFYRIKDKRVAAMLQATYGIFCPETPLALAQVV